MPTPIEETIASYSKVCIFHWLFHIFPWNSRQFHGKKSEFFIFLFYFLFYFIFYACVDSSGNPSENPTSAWDGEGEREQFMWDSTFSVFLFLNVHLNQTLELHIIFLKNNIRPSWSAELWETR